MRLPKYKQVIYTTCILVNFFQGIHQLVAQQYSCLHLSGSQVKLQICPLPLVWSALGCGYSVGPCGGHGKTYSDSSHQLSAPAQCWHSTGLIQEPLNSTSKFFNTNSKQDANKRKGKSQVKETQLWCVCLAPWGVWFNPHPLFVFLKQGFHVVPAALQLAVWLTKTQNFNSPYLQLLPMLEFCE